MLLDAPRGVSAQSVAFPFHPLSEAVFAPVHGYRAAHEVVDTAGGGGAAAPACVEFRTALFPPHGGSSALQRSVGLPTRCAGSPLVRGFVARAMAALPGVRDVPPAASPSDPGHTLLLVRGAAALRKVTHPAWDARVAAARASPGVRVLDPSSVPLFDQMRAVRRARRVEGQHGAALAHFMWMREGAAAVEVDKDMQARACGPGSASPWLPACARLTRAAPLSRRLSPRPVPMLPQPGGVEQRELRADQSVT